MPAPKAKITTKCQITVPREVRRRLGVGPGDRLIFLESKTGYRVKPERNESVFEQFRGIGNPGIPRGRKGLMRWMREMRGK